MRWLCKRKDDPNPDQVAAEAPRFADILTRWAKTLPT
jgi:hypothetical protein